MLTPRALLVVGSLVCALAVVLAALGATLRGAFDPECDLCAPISARALLFLALPTAIFGAVLVAMGIVRREVLREEALRVAGDVRPDSPDSPEELPGPERSGESGPSGESGLTSTGREP